MEIEERGGEGNVLYRITDIKGDMGESARMGLIQQADGDVIVSLADSKRRVVLSIEFCTAAGGGKYPVIAEKLRELVTAIREPGSVYPGLRRRGE